jgi:hypothetical protein
MAAHTHSTALALSEAAPAEVAAGSELMLKIELTCAADCDLQRLPLTIKGPDDTAAAHPAQGWTTELHHWLRSARGGRHSA